MLRDRRSFHGLKHAVDRDKSVTFPFSICLLGKTVFIREDRKSVIFQEKSCFSSSKTKEMKGGLSTD